MIVQYIGGGKANNRRGTHGGNAIVAIRDYPTPHGSEVVKQDRGFFFVRVPARGALGRSKSATYAGQRHLRPGMPCKISGGRIYYVWSDISDALLHFKDCYEFPTSLDADDEPDDGPPLPTSTSGGLFCFSIDETPSSPSSSSEDAGAATGGGASGDLIDLSLI